MTKTKKTFTALLVALALMAAAIVPMAVSPASEPVETAECLTTFWNCPIESARKVAHIIMQQLRQIDYTPSPTPVVCFGNNAFTFGCS